MKSVLLVFNGNIQMTRCFWEGLDHHVLNVGVQQAVIPANRNGGMRQLNEQAGLSLNLEAQKREEKDESHVTKVVCLRA